MIVRIICLIILILDARVLYLTFGIRRWKMLVFYTQLSNIAAMLSVLLVVIFGETSFTSLIRYISSCMLVMTFIVTAFVLVPMGGSAKILLFSGNGLYLHLIIPILSVGSYMLLERHVSNVLYFLVPTVLTFIYGMLMLYLNYKDVVEGPYPFFKVKDQSVPATVLWMSVLTCVIALISFGVFRLSAQA